MISWIKLDYNWSIYDPMDIYKWIITDQYIITWIKLNYTGLIYDHYMKTGSLYCFKRFSVSYIISWIKYSMSDRKWRKRGLYDQEISYYMYTPCGETLGGIFIWIKYPNISQLVYPWYRILTHWYMSIYGNRQGRQGRYNTIENTRRQLTDTIWFTDRHTFRCHDLQDSNFFAFYRLISELLNW